ncbi:hypothetical protein HUT16_04555 [Kitasatospora sp. NA04385]|uniref:hypothetical protein n=1 Tax=Kitasatospora sp. NA04385 TaxID=2742135 RepID=UPI00159172AF|nr:hypothetical protein [Kitasatospora sp. NA04385]QKW18433.1 hypothetical protein HUT16_04555 [Kitasatospora sp. NA04385]
MRFPMLMQVWSYQISHRLLVFRSYEKEGDTTATEIEFVGVVGMKTRSSYRSLTLQEVESDREMQDLVNIPDRLSHRFRRIRLLDGEEPAGFVVCGNVRVREVPLGY